MLTTILTALCALTISTADVTTLADTLDTYVIDAVQIKDFDGSQLVGKTITNYHISCLTLKEGVTRIHNIVTNDFKAPDGVQVIGYGTTDEAQIRVLKTSSSMPDPIYVIDGKVVTSDEFKSIKPSNIESIEILKGGASEVHRKYTDRDDVGIILITTKKSK